MEAFGHFVFPVDRQVWRIGQGVKNLLLPPRPRRQNAKAAIVQDLKAGQLEEVQVLVENDLVHQRSLLHGGHAVVRGDDDIQAVTQFVAMDGVSQVADGAVYLLDDLLPAGVVRPLGVAHVVRFSVVQRHQVEVLLGKPAQHRVDVLLPLRLVVVRMASFRHHNPVHGLATVIGSASREEERGCFQALKPQSRSDVLLAYFVSTLTEDSMFVVRHLVLRCDP